MFWIAWKWLFLKISQIFSSHLCPSLPPPSPPAPTPLLATQYWHELPDFCPKHTACKKLNTLRFKRFFVVVLRGFDKVYVEREALHPWCGQSCKKVKACSFKHNQDSYHPFKVKFAHVWLLTELEILLFMRFSLNLLGYMITASDIGLPSFYTLYVPGPLQFKWDCSSLPGTRGWWISYWY